MAKMCGYLNSYKINKKNRLDTCLALLDILPLHSPKSKRRPQSKKFGGVGEWLKPPVC